MSDYTVNSGFIKDDEYIKFKPSNVWPKGTHFQLGKSNNKCRIEAYTSNYYITSFEDTLEEAEKKLFQRYIKISKCVHLTARRKWDNGGGICLKCKEFIPHAFKPIYKMKYNIFQICIDNLILMLPIYNNNSLKKENDIYQRRQYLILKLAGFKIPYIKDYTDKKEYIKDYINTFEETLNNKNYDTKYFYTNREKTINKCFEELKEGILELKEEMKL